jgi:hypothetical protein
MNDYYEIMEDVESTINNHTYVVDQWLLDTLDEEFEKSAYKNRKNVDALALEKTAIRAGKMKVGEIVNNEGYQWRHDWKYNENTFIDLKRKPLKYTNISLGTMKRMIESYNMNELTHIVAYSQNIEHDYKIGDKLTFEFLGMLPFRKVYDWRHVKNDGLSYLSIFNLQTV